MRKHLLAVLSIFGLAGSSTPASAQVVKGATQTDTKSESTMKKSKISQEDAASKDAGKAKEMRKAGGDQQVQKADYMKSAKSNAELKASQGATEYKGQKATIEKTAVGAESKHKAAASELNAVKQDAAKKAQKQVNQASPK